MKTKIVFISILMLLIASVEGRRQNPPGCKNSQPQLSNPLCTSTTTPVVTTKPPEGDVHQFELGSHDLDTTSPPSATQEPLIATGLQGPAFQGTALPPPHKTHKGDPSQKQSHKYLVPQPYQVPPSPKQQQLVATGLQGPAFQGTALPPPHKTHKGDDVKYTTPQPYAVPPKPKTQSQVVIGTYGPSWSGFSPVVVTPQKGTKPKHPHMVNVHTTQAKNPDHHPNHHIPSVAGKGMVDGHRSQFVQANGHVWTCALSGMSRRVIKDQMGKSRLVGHAETLHFRDSITAHLPSNHRLEANCLVTVNKHAKQ